MNFTCKTMDRRQ